MACLPAAVSLLLLEALFMQISGVSLTLTWPHRLCLLRVLLCTATSFPLSKHTGGGDTAPAFSGLACLFTVPGRIPLPPFGAQCAPPSLQCVFIVIAYYSVFFFPRVEVGLSRGLCCSGPGLSVGVPHTT
jgi:hypothetical protein